MKNFTKIITAVSLAATAALGLAMPAYADPAGGGTSTTICDQEYVSPEVKAAAGCPDVGEAADFSGSITGILSGIIGILGIVAVIVIIVGGVNYMTSTGDPSKTKKAKDTILYGCIGLIICVLAFVIVNFVIVGVLKQTPPSNP